MAAQDNGANRAEMLDRLAFLLACCNDGYAAYMASGQGFLQARRLYRLNTEIEELLVERGHLLGQAHWPAVSALMNHIQVWRLRWEAANLAQAPGLTDRFAFENDVTFPRDAVAALMALRGG